MELIDRQKAIEALQKGRPIWKDGDDYQYGRASQWTSDIMTIERVEAENRWIPCSERVPDDLAEVNVTYVNHDPEQYYDFTKDKPFTASAVYYNGEWYWYSSTCADYLAEYGRNDVDKVDDAIEITAWMPLPKPYEERREEE